MNYATGQVKKVRNVKTMKEAVCKKDVWLLYRKHIFSHSVYLIKKNEHTLVFNILQSIKYTFMKTSIENRNSCRQGERLWKVKEGSHVERSEG